MAGKCKSCGKELLENETDYCLDCQSQNQHAEEEYKEETENLSNKDKLFTERTIAAAIDGIILVLLSLILWFVWSKIPFLGKWHSLGTFLISSISVIYLAVRDYLFDGQSIGKKIMGLKVCRKSDGQLIGLNESLMRNLDIAIFPAIGAVLKLIPVLFLGFFTFVISLLNILLGIASFAVVVLEGWFLYKNGERFGDKLAGTIVKKDET